MRRSGALIFATVLAVNTGCKHDHEEGHDHSEAHPEGHDHHDEGHGHGDSPVIKMTLWSDRYELFGEHEPAVVGSKVAFLLHVTELDGFRAVDVGGATLHFDGPATLEATVKQPARPGIFKIDITPTVYGEYKGWLEIHGGPGKVGGKIRGLTLDVYDDKAEAEAVATEDDDDGVIEFLKEQQWRVPFGTQFVTTSTIVAAVDVSGLIDTPPGGSAEVGASVAGRIVAPTRGLPRPGDRVRKGQVLATLIPTPSSPEGAARASLVVAEAAARASAAQMAVERAERLFATEAISKRELEDARREDKVARESVRAARQAAEMYASASTSSRQGTWQLTAPISGTLVSVKATPGATPSPGTTLFRIVDTSELWVIAKVPEQDAARLRTDRDVSYKIAGLDTWRTIAIGADRAARRGALVTIGREVDRVSRTVEVIYSVRDPDPSMRVGGLLQVNLPAGPDFSGVVIARSALIDQEGRHLVYVQSDGEHFEARPVRVGPSAGDRVGIVEGLKAGERIVTRGAHLIRLADRAKGAPAHGHVH